MSNNQPEVGVFVPIDAVFPELRADEDTMIRLVRELSRTDTLFWCARLNLLVSGAGDDDPKARQQWALDHLCTSQEIESMNPVAKAHGGADHVRVFFRGQLLELMRWAARYSIDHPNDGTTFDDPAVRKRFVQAALIASQLWADRVFHDRFSLEGGLDAARRRGLASIRKAIEEAGRAPDLEFSLGRGWALFSEYFPRRHSGFAEEFRAATGVTPEEYYVNVAAIVAHFMSPRTQTPIFRWSETAAATQFREIFPRYVALESQTADDLAAALWETHAAAGHRSLRERPILRTADGRAIVLDPIYYSERASIGPLFHLLGPQVSSGKAHAIFGAFGQAFEDYAADILRRMYPAAEGLAQRLSCNMEGCDTSGRQLEVDAVLNDVTELVIFETKAAWLREDHILEGAPEDYLEHLRAKYGVPIEPEAAERCHPESVRRQARHPQAVRL